MNEKNEYMEIDLLAMLKALLNRWWIICATDIAIFLCSYVLARLIGIVSPLETAKFAISELFQLLIIPTVYMLVFVAFGTHKTMWRYADEKDYIKVWLIALFAGGIISVIGTYALKVTLTENIIFVLIETTVIAISRLTYRIITKLDRSKKSDNDKKRLLIVGAGICGNSMIEEIMANPLCGLEIVGLADDDPAKLGRKIYDYQVLGMTEDIPSICKKKNVELIYIAMPSVSSSVKAHILEYCLKTKCDVKTLPYYTEIGDENDVLISKVRNITPDELLGRDPIDLSELKKDEFVSGKTVAITGGGGSIGSELCRQIALHKPKRLIIIDIYENNAYEIQQELILKYGKALDLAVYIASVREYEKIHYIFNKEKPDIVIHAAAHKHVPLMETSPEEAVKNNIFGTFNTARAALENEVERFILISTDKAVNPTNVMGATKRACEMIVQYFGKFSGDVTTFTAVRFGNVLGSNGSVIPLFREQILKRRDVTVTDPNIIRYFMTIPEASQLVIAAGAMAKGGETFVLDMGEPVKIDDLARRMIAMAGLELGRDINIKYIGLRPGEKLYEELLMSEEGLRKTDNKKIFIGHDIELDHNTFLSELYELKAIAYEAEPDACKIEKKLREIVPTFIRPEDVNHAFEAEASEELAPV